jgi:hypothetical protein
MHLLSDEAIDLCVERRVCFCETFAWSRLFPLGFQPQILTTELSLAINRIREERLWVDMNNPGQQLWDAIHGVC